MLIAIFSARSHLTFNYQLQTGLIKSTVTTLEGISTTQTQETKNKNLVGIGRVNKNSHQGTYTIYNPYIDNSHR